jgi:dihydroorotase
LVQHSLPAMLEFFHDGKITLEKVVELMCHKPAQCFNVVKRGFIRKKYFADLVLLDFSKQSHVDSGSLLYKCKWSPFEGYTFNSKVAYTFVNGQMVYNGETISDHVRGMRLEFRNP